MRLAVVNKCFSEEFRNETNIRVNEIETSLEDKIKKLTETKHYDELNIDAEGINITGEILYNNSWKYCNLICLDFAFQPSYGVYCVSTGLYETAGKSCGLLREWHHDLTLDDVLVFNTYDPNLGMYQLNTWAVFHPNGLLDLTPHFGWHTVVSKNCSTSSYDQFGYSGTIAVNCLFIYSNTCGTVAHCYKSRPQCYE